VTVRTMPACREEFVAAGKTDTLARGELTS
jgi:hypothetical protein